MSSPTRPAVYIETFGCQMNVLDSELVEGQLEALGYPKAERVEDAGIVLLNTCSVRELSEQKVWSQLGRLNMAKRTHHPDLVVGVLGCMAEREGAAIVSRVPAVDIVCGPSNLDRLPALVENVLRNRQGGPQLSLAGHNSRRSSTLEAAADGVETMDLSRAFYPREAGDQAYVRITRGCDKMCSFCVVPFTRGPEVHRPPNQIIEEVRGLVGAGAMEVTLIGQTVNHYLHREGGRSTSFADLLRRVHDEVPELPRLRFVTSYPRDFSDEALDVMAESPRICRYLHVPVQSGSNRLLRLMNRGYTVEEYEALLARARQRMPDIRLATDIIVGFPTETEDDHRATLGLLERGRFKGCFAFKYSPRPGTVAERRLPDDVPEADKHRRNLEVIDLHNRLNQAALQGLLGQELEVLVAGTSKFKRHGPVAAPTQNGELVQLRGVPSSGSSLPNAGVTTRLIGRTQGDEIVAFDGAPELLGTLVRVRALAATHLTVIGELTAV